MRLAAASGCAGSADDSAGTSSTPSPVHGEITVLAAASLTEAFTALGSAFEADHPGTKVTFSFGASSALAQQVLQGAPADVFASASPANMRQVTDDGAAEAPAEFARNVMQVAVPRGNPARISSVADLGQDGVKVVLCQPAVPCGAVAREVLGNAGVHVTPVSQEADVKAVLAKVELGEADAGIVYVTDVRAAQRKVEGISVPDRLNASTSYPIATLKASHNAATAKAFVDLVLSANGTAALRSAGFQQP
jgi:molybdate transport system substrate-binding protein